MSVNVKKTSKRNVITNHDKRTKVVVQLTKQAYIRHGLSNMLRTETAMKGKVTDTD